MDGGWRWLKWLTIFAQQIFDKPSASDAAPRAIGEYDRAKQYRIVILVSSDAAGLSRWQEFPAGNRAMKLVCR